MCSSYPFCHLKPANHSSHARASQEYESLAHDAAEALGRLIAVLGDVVSEEEAEEAEEAARDNAAAAALAVKDE